MLYFLFDCRSLEFKIVQARERHPAYSDSSFGGSRSSKSPPIFSYCAGLLKIVFNPTSFMLSSTYFPLYTYSTSPRFDIEKWQTTISDSLLKQILSFQIQLAYILSTMHPLCKAEAAMWCP